MIRSRFQPAAGFFVIALAFVMGSPAFAQEAADTNEALRRARQAESQFEAKQWSKAYDGYAAADALVHSPVFVLYMARARRHAGRLLEADALYRRVATEDLGDAPPKPFVEAQLEATAERLLLSKRIPEVTIVVVGEGAVVTIDGDPARVGAVRLDPGPHTIAARMGDDTREQQVVLAEGARETVQLDFGTNPATITADDGNDGGSYIPAIVAFSLGGASILVGVVTGGIAASMASSIREGCIDGHCLASDADDLDTARTLALVSTITFIAGGVGLATGTVLLFVRPGGAASSPATVGMQLSF